MPDVNDAGKVKRALPMVSGSSDSNKSNGVNGASNAERPIVLPAEFGRTFLKEEAQLGPSLGTSPAFVGAERAAAAKVETNPLLTYLKQPVVYHDGKKLKGLLELDRQIVKDFHGGKGSSLMAHKVLYPRVKDHTQIKDPVFVSTPEGFTVGVSECKKFDEYKSKTGGAISDELKKSIDENLTRLESESGKSFGDVENPLLVAVRSGAPVSMPGMMDTCLFVGATKDWAEKREVYIDSKAAEWGEKKVEAEKRFTWDCYRRNLQMFGDIVYHLGGKDGHKFFQRIIEGLKTEKGYKNDKKLNSDDMKKLASDFEKVFHDNDKELPETGREQVYVAASAVFKSWSSPGSIGFRKDENLSSDSGTAVNVQEMILGNKTKSSGTLVLESTRNPKTGEFELKGNFKTAAAGEDVVDGGSGTPIAKLGEENKLLIPVKEKIIEVAKALEAVNCDIQDLEMTWEEVSPGKFQLCVLQSRTARLYGRSKLMGTLGLENDGIITERQLVEMMKPEQFEALMAPEFKEEELEAARENKLDKSKPMLVGKGTSGVPGAATGVVALSREQANKYIEEGKDTVLVVDMTGPDDVKTLRNDKLVAGMTKLGSTSSHVVVICRGMGKCAAVDFKGLTFTEKEGVKGFDLNGTFIAEGETISVNTHGEESEVFTGDIPKTPPKPFPEEALKMLDELEKYAKVKVMSNSEIPNEVDLSVIHGAKGVGLFRLEHIYEDESKKTIARVMTGDYANAAEKSELLKQISDHAYTYIKHALKANDGQFTTVRLLDPPSHEFLPVEEKDKVERPEVDPTFGRNSLRLVLTSPLAKKQFKGILEALKDSNSSKKVRVPLVGVSKPGEIIAAQNALMMAAMDLGDPRLKERVQFDLVVESAAACKNIKKLLPYLGPKAKVSVDRNKLAESVLGLSQYDFEKNKSFRDKYLEKGFYARDPFDLEQDPLEAVQAYLDDLYNLGLEANKDFSYTIGVKPHADDYLYTDGFIQEAFREGVENKDRADRILASRSEKKLTEEDKALLDQIQSIQKGMVEGGLKNVSGDLTVNLFRGNLEDLYPEKFSRVVHEKNPMIGLRAARLIPTQPELTKATMKAMFRAVKDLKAEGFDPKLGTEIPLVSSVEEVRFAKQLMDAAAKEVFGEQDEYPYSPGIMIECPAAVKLVGKMLKALKEGAKTEEVFASYGTNDLTQTGLRFGREGAIDDYNRNGLLEQGIFKFPPFVEVNPGGPINAMIEESSKSARKVVSGMKLAMCGVQAANPKTARICTENGVDLSVTAREVPGARGHAIQAGIEQGMTI